jgi:hypothetical protein
MSWNAQSAIDIVVEGAGKRLAVECDGDRYHPIEKLAEDGERQAILERLGWKFVRIKGSVFFRNPQRAMQDVFSRLDELGIPPEGNSTEAPANDWTVVYELIASADENIQGKQASTTLSSHDSGDMDDSGGLNLVDLESSENTVARAPKSFIDGQFPGISRDLMRGQVEALLEKMGGAVFLADFMHHLAKARGFQRLGSAIRKSMHSEIGALALKGKVSIEDGRIRLSGATPTIEASIADPQTGRDADGIGADIPLLEGLQVASED